MLKIGNKIYRNLQEQVAKNMEDIDEIKKAMPIPYNEYYTKEEIAELIPKQHQAKLYTSENRYFVVNYMHPKSTALTKEEFLEYLKKIKYLPNVKLGRDVYGGNSYVFYGIAYPLDYEEIIECKTIYIDQNNPPELADDNEEYTPEQITIEDRVIEY